MYKVFLYIKTALKASSTYKTNFIGSLVVALFANSFRILFVDSLFQFSNSIAGWTLQDLYGLVLTMMFLSFLIDLFASSVHSFFASMVTGRSDVLLLQPVPIPFLIFLRWLSAHELVICITLAVLCSFLFDISILFTSISASASLLITIISSIVVNISFITILHTISFIGQRALPIDYIHIELSKMNLIPPSLFNQSVLNTVVLFFPMVVSAGITVLSFKYPFSSLTILFWFASVLSMIVCILVFQAMLRKRVVQGG